MTAGGDLPSQHKARGGIQRFRDGVDELLHGREVFCLSIPEVLDVNTREGVGASLEPRQFLLAAAAPRVNRRPVGGVAAGDVDFDDAG